MSTILEILEIEVSIIPRILEMFENCSLLFSTILEILEIEVSIIPRILEMRAAGGWLQELCCAACVFFWEPLPEIL